ncbi:MAG: hypothetical protein Kow0099_13900 [Candidatus Abyssubacteria bacterium]
MQCAVHPEKKALGYCKKCGTLGCELCLTRVNVTGGKGGRTAVTEVLVCRECLSKIRPDLLPSQKKKSSGSIRPARYGSYSKLAGIAIAIAVAVTVAVVFLPRINVKHQLMSADQITIGALEALSAGNMDRFLSYLDVETFMCKMDSTGLTLRDYAEASQERRSELISSHVDLLMTDFLVKGNLRRKFEVVDQEIKSDSAVVAVKPWVCFGNKLYKKVLLEKKLGEWKICGLAAPDY